MKVDRFQILYWSKIATFFVGIVLSVVYQFTGSGTCLLTGLALFACAFLLITVTEIANLVVLSATLIEEETPAQVEQKKKELANKKLLAVCKMLLSFGMGAFAIVIMFLF